MADLPPVHESNTVYLDKVSIEQRAPVCRECSSPQPEPGYSIPLCSACRQRLFKRPFPAWVLGTAALVALILLVSFIRFPSEVQAGVAYERGKKMEDRKNYPAALDQYRKVLRRYPDSVHVEARLGIAQYHSGDIESAINTFAKLEGKDVGKDLKEEVDSIFAELDRLMAEAKAKKGGS